MSRVKRRLVVPEGTLAPGAQPLSSELAHYVRSVLRLGAGEAMRLTDGAGRVADARILRVASETVEVEVGSVSTASRPRPRVTLIQAVAKGHKMDTVVRQAGELGVERLVPVTTARTVARAQGRTSRWSGIADDATRVSGRAHRMTVEPVQPLAAVLERPRAALALVLTGHAPESLREQLGPGTGLDTAEILIGPEGGLDPDELERAKVAGFLAANLGAYNLRTETAGAAVTAILMFHADQVGGGA